MDVLRGDSVGMIGLALLAFLDGERDVSGELGMPKVSEKTIKVAPGRVMFKPHVIVSWSPSCLASASGTTPHLRYNRRLPSIGAPRASR